MKVGLFDHFGYAVAVTATDGHDVVDRRKIALVDEEVTDAPVHYDLRTLDDAAAEALLTRWRASVRRAIAASFDALPQPIEGVCLRAFPDDYPTDIATLRADPYHSRADAIFYRQLLAEAADRRGWSVHLYDAKSVEAQAATILGAALPKLGPPWSKDHRVCFAATVVAGVSA